MKLVEVTGRQVLDMLEWSVHSMPEEFGGFEQTAGLTYEVDPDLKTPCVEEDKKFAEVDETMPRRVSNVKVGGEEIDPDARYRLVINEYIQLEGAGFTMLREAKVLMGSDAVDSEVLEEYISGKLNGVVGEEYADPHGQGRMSTKED